MKKPGIAALSMVLVLACSLHASNAQTNDSPDESYTKAAFWLKSYSIPLSYQRVVAQTFADGPTEARLQTDLARLGWNRVPLPPDSDRNVSAWLAPNDDVGDALAPIYKATKVGAVDAQVPAHRPPDYPELDYKISHLSEEAGRIGLSSATMPAIAGLVNAQLATLRRLVQKRDAAKRSTLVLLLNNVPNEGVGPWLDGCDARHCVGSKGELIRDLWERASVDTSCQRTPETVAVALAVSRAALPRSMEEVSELTHELVRPTPTELCISPGPSYLLVPTDSLPEFRRRLRQIGKVASWKTTSNADLGVARAWRKAKLLQQDLASVGGRLRDAPHVNTLVQAEIARLQPGVEAYERLRSQTLVTVQVVAQSWWRRLLPF